MTEEERKFVDDVQQAVQNLNNLIRTAAALKLEVSVETLDPLSHRSLSEWEDLSPSTPQLIQVTVKKHLYNGPFVL